MAAYLTDDLVYISFLSRGLTAFMFQTSVTAQHDLLSWIDQFRMTEPTPLRKSLSAVILHQSENLSGPARA